MGRPLVNIIEHTRVAPDFRIEGAAARIEDTHYGPVAAAKPNGIVESQPAVSTGGIVAHDQLGKTRLEHATLNDLYVLADGEHIRRNSANMYVGISTSRAQRKRRDRNAL